MSLYRYSVATRRSPTAFKFRTRLAACRFAASWKLTNAARVAQVFKLDSSGRPTMEVTCTGGVFGAMRRRRRRRRLAPRRRK